jgi:hypothetical protein
MSVYYAVSHFLMVNFQSLNCERTILFIEPQAVKFEIYQFILDAEDSSLR